MLFYALHVDHDQATWYSRCFPTKLDTNKQILSIQQKVCLRKQSDEKNFERQTLLWHQKWEYGIWERIDGGGAIIYHSLRQ